ncbi:MAG: coenzyme F420-0:L-glutamate ligase [Betaproteobacteria bacterium]|nr:coenzyme F420-0:L-glutamate ligase [Betaproteobacteria bacterium]
MSTASRLELIGLEGIGAVRAGDDLGALIAQALTGNGLTLRNGDVIAVAQKIVSKSENRYVLLDSVVPSARALDIAVLCDKDPRIVEIVLSESRAVLRAVPGVIVVEDRRGLVLANAGVDRSNVDMDEDGRERVLLLPADPDQSAARLRKSLAALCGADVGVIINDSLGRAWRLGTVGVAIGVAGLPGLLDRRGAADLQGRPLLITEVGMADELAAAASALMGQAAEGRPVVLIRGVAWPRREGNARELQRARGKDLFR